MQKFLNEMEQCVPDLRRYAMALLREHYAADDLVQDTLERAIKKRSLFQRQANLKPWLFKIMLNIFRNDKYRERRHNELDGVMGDMRTDATPANQDWHMECVETFKAIEKLAEDQRQAILLISTGGLDYKQAAKVLQIPMGTFMSRLGRARSNLRALMNENPRPNNKGVK